MINQQRAAMQMALETLCNAVKPKRGNYYSLTEVPIDCAYKYQQAITALREALRNTSERMAQPQGEPVAWCCRAVGGNGELFGFFTDPDEIDPDSDNTIPLYTAPPSVEAAIEATKENESKVYHRLVESAVAHAIEATKEKAAKMCERVDTDAFGKERPTPEDCSAAIRSMK